MPTPAKKKPGKSVKSHKRTTSSHSICPSNRESVKCNKFYVCHQFSFERGTSPYFVLSIIFSPFIKATASNGQWYHTFSLKFFALFYLSPHWIFFCLLSWANCEGVRVNKEGEQMAQEGMLHTLNSSGGLKWTTINFLFPLAVSRLLRANLACLISCGDGGHL